ncbi:MFS transporter [Variovorax sp. J22R133]|uniref:MFS transporter n=1 Tax=Variovorax brevis TaxID=3053503 RepID=UPI002576DFAA|nr:MFS transporter [Variovorax sp. J22R133]MDM0114802.1 MFS transporter [Variovorax sp. J22R133]
MTTQEYRPVRAWSIATMLTLFILVNFADKIVVGLVAVPMMEELKLSPTEFGLIGSSFFWLFAISGIVGGFLADRLNTKWMLLVMALAWSVCQLPMALSSSMAVIIVARVLLGAGEGPAWPVTVHAAYKWFPDNKRNLPVALFSQGGAIGLLIAGLAVPLITARYGWRGSFYALAAIGVIWALVWAVVGAEGKIGNKDKAALAKAKATDAPMGRVLRDPTVLGNFMLHFVGYWGLGASLTWLPAYFQKGLGYDNVASGRLYGVVVAVSIPLVLLVSWWSQRLLAKGWSSRDARARFASIALIVGGVLMGMMMLDGPSNAMRIGFFALAFGLTTAIYSLGPAMLAQVAPESRRGAVLALDNSIASLAGLLAPAISGRLIQATTGAAGFEHGFALTGALMAIGGIIGYFILDPEASAARLRR